MTTDTTEKGLEGLIVSAMTGRSSELADTGTGWIGGDPKEYDRGYAVDLFQFSAFLKATQPE